MVIDMTSATDIFTTFFTQLLAATLPPGPVVRTWQNDTLESIRSRFYPRFDTVNIVEWESRFARLNKPWQIVPESRFPSDVLLHMPKIDPFGVRLALSGDANLDS